MVGLGERTSVSRSARWRVDALAVFALALVVRVAFVLASTGGPSGAFGYDSGVYYASASALIHGQLPYRDFVFLHPPGLMLAVTPFALVGRLTSDHAGFIVANAACVVLGSVNAALVVATGRRFGLSRAAALLGGVFYAVWFGAVGAEVSVRLEPVGTFAFLCGMWLLLDRSPRRPGSIVAAGAAMGVAASVKIWWIVPALVVLGWLLRPGEPRRRGALFAAGSTAGIAAVTGPFFVLSPATMWRMVVADQLSRHPSRPGGTARLLELTSMHAVVSGLSPAVRLVIVAAVGLLFLVIAIAAWRHRRGRVIVLVVVAQLVVLMRAPTYFPYYSGYLAPGVALLIAVAVQANGTGPTARVAGYGARAVVAAATLLTMGALVLRPVTLSSPFPAAQLARGVVHVRCLMTDSPMALIELDALSRNLDNGCPNWVDVSGRTYDSDAPAPGHFERRSRNAKWQADILRYLDSGDAAIVIRSATGLSADTERRIRQWPVLERSHGYTVYRTQ